MNKPLLLCLLLALCGQTFAQSINFKNFKDLRSSDLKKSAPGISFPDKNIAGIPMLQEGFISAPAKEKVFPDFWPDRISIKLKNDSRNKIITFNTKQERPKTLVPGKLNKLLLRLQANSVKELPRLAKTSSRLTSYEVVLENPNNLNQVLQELNALPEVAYAERVPFYVTLQAPNDPYYLQNYQYALIKTQAAEAFAIHTGTTKTLMAIVDDAVLVSHPDLSTNINLAKSYDVADQDADPRPPATGPNQAGTNNFSHGTHCAGIAGAITNNGVGIAAISNNKVSIMGVKCTRDAAPSSQIIEYPTEGIIYAINQGAKVISMSFGGAGYSQTLQDIINEATANGVVFIAAAGNDNTENKMYPAAFDNVIAVASTDANDLKSNFSNYGNWVDISAPGSGILSTVTANDGTGGVYTYYSGTSMACPMVASLVALMLSENPSLTPQAIIQILRKTAEPLENVPNQDPALAGKLGGGRINAYRAIQAIKGLANDVAPTAIIDLHVIRSGQTEIEIEWTAPDAGGFSASLYDIRYATFPINQDNFALATKTKTSVFPVNPGEKQRFVINELVPATHYYIAMVAKSFYGETSPVSNVVSATTRAAPILEVNPNSYNLQIDRSTNQTISRNFLLTNSGAATLDYTTTLVPIAGSNILAYDKPQQTPDNSVGLEGDSFISAAKFVAGAQGYNLTHVQNYLHSSYFSGPVPVGVKIFKGGTTPGNATLVTAQNFTKVIPANGSLFTFPLQAPQQFAPGEVFWVTFILPAGVDYPQGYDEVAPNPGTFYLSVDNGNSYEDAQTLASFLATAAFKIRAANLDWLTLNPAAGQISTGGSEALNMTGNIANLSNGTYETNILFQSNDVVNPVITKSVTLTVTGGQPVFNINPTEVNWGTLFVGTSRTVKVIISNTGSANLEVNPVALDLGIFAPTDFTLNTQSAINLPPGAQQEVLVTFTPAKTGTLTGMLTLSSNDQAAKIIQLPLSANVVSAPVAVVTPASLDFELEYGGTPSTSQNIQIQNTGQANLSYTLQAVIEPLASIHYSANRPADNYLGFGSSYPYIHTALKFDVTSPTFNLTHVQNYFRTEVAGDKTITMKVYKGGNNPTAGNLLLTQIFEAPAVAVNGALVTLPLQQTLHFSQGDVFWVVFYYSVINQPQGYNTNNSNPGRNYYSANGTNWYALESAGGVYASSTFIIKALEMPQWLSVVPGTGQVAGGTGTQSAVTVNVQGLPEGRYSGTVQVLTNDPNRPLLTVAVNLNLQKTPVADFSTHFTQVFPGEEVTFTNLSQNADAYDWQFEGAQPATSNLATPVVVYNTPGKYKVSLTVQNNQTGRTSATLVKEEYIVVQDIFCQELNSPFTGTENLANNQQGYFTGNNNQSDIAKANFFAHNRSDSYLTGLKVKFGAAATADANATVTFAVWAVNAINGNPGNIITSKEIKIADITADLTAGRITSVIFDAPLQITGNFFAGLILNNKAGNTVAIVHNANTDTTPGVAWTQDSQQNWQPFGTTWPELTNIALYIQPSITRTQNPILADFTLSTDSACPGEAVQLDAAATAGATRLEWLLEGANLNSSTIVNPVVTYAAAGTYQITLKAYDACNGVVVVTKRITIHKIPDATISVSGSLNLCAGEKVVLSAGAGEGWQYLWSTGANTQAIEVSAPGDYSVMVTNSAGCTETSGKVTVFVHDLPPATITASGPTTFCAGDSVILTASEGSAYLWSSGAITRQIRVSSSGEYTVTVTNTAGCQATSAITGVTVNPLPVAVISANGSTSLCAGEQVKLTAEAGENYTYLWSNGATTRSIEVDTAGDYFVIVSNEYNCQVTSNTISVKVDALPVANITTNGATTFCQGGSVVLTASEGSSYLWSNGASSRSIEVNFTGNFSVKVTNAQGCSRTSETIAVKVNALPVATIKANGPTIFCEGGKVILSASTGEGYTYLWSNGATTPSIEVNRSGQYAVTIHNLNGCEAISAATNVSVNPLPVATVVASGPTTFCEGGTVTLSAPAGNSYLWSTGATARQIIVAASGDYWVTVKNADGCQATSALTKVVVNPLPNPTIIISGATNFCTGEYVVLSAPEGDGYTYSWSNGAATRSIRVDQGGIYRVTITNNMGCQAISEPVAVTVNPLPVNTIMANGPTTFCAGGSVTLTAAAGNGYLYRWTNNATTQSITVNTSGTYSVTVTNMFGCTVHSEVIPITVNPLPVATITAQGATTFCQGNSVVLTASEGSSYLWSNGATSQSILVNTAGEYSVKITNSFGCEATATPVRVQVNELPIATVTAGGPTTFCAGGSVLLTASAGTHYLWSNGATTRQIIAETSGHYSVLITNAAGCQSTSAATPVTVLPLPVATVTTKGSTTLCQGERVTLTGPDGSGLIYQWSNGATTRSITVDTGGNYHVTVTNVEGCATTSKAVVVKVNPLPQASVTTLGATTLCQGDKVTLMASAGENYTYQWSNGASTRSIEVNSAGNYSVMVTNEFGCTATSSIINIKVNPLPVAIIIPNGPTTFCFNKNVELTASEGSSYLWSNGATSRSIKVSETGTYTVIVTNSNGCAATSAEIKTIMNSLPAKPTIYLKDVVLTSSAGNGNQWFWNNSLIVGAHEAVYEATEPGIYRVQVTNVNGCISEMSAEVEVTAQDLIPDLTIYPNPGNGHFTINFTGVKPEMVNYLILNSLGQSVYGDNKKMLGEWELKVDISQLAAGVYILQMQSNNQVFSRRIVVQH